MAYSIHPVDLELFKYDILKLWNENSEFSIEYKYEWFYQANPAGKAKVWLLRHDESAEYVGMTALFPKNVRVNDKIFKAGISGDLFVNKKHRSLGPAVMLQKSVIRATRRDEFDFIFGTPNEKSEPIMKHVGYKLLAPQLIYVKALKSAPYLRKKGIATWAAAILGVVIDFVLKLFAMETWYKGAKDFKCEEIQYFDKRFDSLSGNKDSRISAFADRSPEVLQWRLLNHPRIKINVFAIFDSTKSVAQGFIAYYSTINSIEIIDFHFPSDRKATFTLLSCFLRHCRSFSKNSIAAKFTLNKNIEKIFRYFGFFNKKNSKQNIYIYYNDSILSRIPFIGDSNCWLLTPGDNDEF